ncbi:MAG: hypothetical protein CVV64_01525 [Candidatus Wallbacteria bacterium HGW-Wallbacteria-1]|jgi:YesN/AraC family two-component response regulator|uniref:Response regulatory domain-containing protein n=1 Tax=Candidatus Wallbacteria bacterium HGW-Wallbacteria-1 TaxID=2013854 RepID=A0A2N1PUW0_9BACT|nr:MAG: hypothetical protein CVV64_01525 [Candidatus Wallbacteria bacterium HGW-Wallbacteria-1]
MYRILVIDDEQQILNLITKYLTKNFGYQVDVASDGDEGLELIKANKYNLVISDIRMPRLDGITLLARKNEFDPFLPVILITGKSNFDNVLAALRHGAKNYLMKPFSLRELGEAVTKALEFYEVTTEPKKIWEEVETMVTNRTVTMEMPTSLTAIKNVSNYFMELARMSGFEEKNAQDIFISLNEIIGNAVEHGNLELQGEKNNDYFELREKRLESPDYNTRKVRVEARIDGEKAQFTIQDEGPGFDFRAVENCLDPANIIKNSGRGIFLATCFMNHLNYEDPGNMVTLIKLNN